MPGHVHSSASSAGGDDTEKLEDPHLINQTVLASSEYSQFATGSESFLTCRLGGVLGESDFGELLEGLILYRPHHHHPMPLMCHHTPNLSSSCFRGTPCASALWGLLAIYQCGSFGCWLAGLQRVLASAGALALGARPALRRAPSSDPF